MDSRRFEGGAKRRGGGGVGGVGEPVREQQSCWAEGRTGDLWRPPKERLAPGHYLGGSGGEAELLTLGAARSTRSQDLTLGGRRDELRFLPDPVAGSLGKV